MQENFIGSFSLLFFFFFFFLSFFLPFFFLVLFNAETQLNVVRTISDGLSLLYYIDLSRAKSEALDNIYSLFKQNIKTCNAKCAARAAHFFCTSL